MWLEARDGQDDTNVLGPCAACALPCHTPSASAVHAGTNPTHSRTFHCTSTATYDDLAHDGAGAGVTWSIHVVRVAGACLSGNPWSDRC